MSYPSYPTGNPEVENATPNDQNADQLDSYKTLGVEVLRRVPHTCDHDYSMAGLTQLWKKHWHIKICLLWLNDEGKDWPDIIKWFEEKGIGHSYKALHTEWTRVSNEVKAMRGAAEEYKGLCELAWALEIEPPDPWDSISDSMKDYGAKESWTPGKVKYAWHHGASTLFHDIPIVCKLDG